MLILPRLLIICCCFVLAACSTPRGAGLLSEVLANDASGDGEKAAAYDFAIYAVTRTNINKFSSWPDFDKRRLGWIKRRPQLASFNIASGDLLDITIWDPAKSSLLTNDGQQSITLRNTKVSTTGRIFVPFVGQLNVVGMSLDTARNHVQSRIEETFPSAQIQLSAVPGPLNSVSLVAGVSKPGSYALPDSNFSLLSLLSQGGGVRPGLNNPQVRLVRQSKSYRTSLQMIYDDPAMDTILQGEDRVIVEPDARAFLSLGATGSEARHEFVKEKMTVLDGMAIIGGVADVRADPKGVLILRNYPSNAVRADGSGPNKRRAVFAIDLTTADGLFSAGEFILMPDDLVYATESPINSAATIVDLLARITGLAQRF